MQKNLRKILGVGTLGALMAFAAPVVADVFDDWDTDNEAGISDDEWDAGFGENGIFDTWDADADGTLTEDEFNTGVYDAYDENDDDILDDQEFAEYEEEEQGFWDI